MKAEPNGEPKSLPAFQLVYDPEKRGTAFRVDASFPIPDLINGLFTALLAYGSISVQAIMQAQQQQQRTAVVGPDGMPLPRG